MAICSICSGRSFGPAPGNRLSTKRKLPPLCLGCRSTERHRISRVVQEKLRIAEKYKDMAALAWSETPRIEDKWFRAVTRLPPDSEAKIEAMADGSVDFAVVENILHRCEDPRRLLLQLARIVGDDGLLLLSYPNPVTREKTEEWGTPDPKRAGARRIIGRDFETLYAEIVPDLIVMRIEETDPVTNEVDYVYVATKTAAWMRRVLHNDLDVRILA